MVPRLTDEFFIGSEGDIVLVRKAIRDAAKTIGFMGTDITRIVTATSELARNIFKHAGSGKVHYQREFQFGQVGIEIIFSDKGPGIVDISRAMLPGYTTGDGLGMGLPGSRRLMDHMEILSTVDQGTSITVWKWLPR